MLSEFRDYQLGFESSQGRLSPVYQIGKLRIAVAFRGQRNRDPLRAQSFFASEAKILVGLRHASRCL